MSDLSTAPEAQGTGQPDQGQAAAEVSGQAPVIESGQAEAKRDSMAGQAESTQAMDTFFDPSKLPDELKVAYKQMQAAYTRKTQDIAKQRQKIEAYDQATRDPIGTMQQWAAQYGMQLTRAEARQAIQQQQEQSQAEEWQPKTWDDVLNRAKSMAKEEIMREMAPVMQNVQKMQATSIEKQLADIDPNWRVYEDDMRQTLQRHPTLVGDVSMLYRLSVPEEHYTSKAVQQALAKFQSKANQAAVGTKTQTPRSAPAPRKVGSFQEAVDEAKRMLNEQGR
jgi:hypothetical protein